MVNARKSCHQCKYLEWVEGETESTTGWACDKRQDAIFNSSPDWPLIESEFLSKLEDEKYRNRYKRCFEHGGE